jgi:pilus assembly protein Flp/PilA
MMKLHRILAAKAQKGVTMIEYALIAALIAIVAITALTSVGQNLLAKFTAIATSLK